MSEVVMIKKHNLNTKTSVYGVHVYGCNYCIAPKGEQMLRKRGFHMTDDEIKDMLHNLPEEFKPYVRFIKNESDATNYVEEEVKEVKELIKAKNEMKTELDDKLHCGFCDTEIVDGECPNIDCEGKKIAESVNEIDPEPIVELPEILTVDYSEFNDDELYKYKIELKAYAKENGIKIHPALKDIGKIIEKIKG